MSYTNDLEIFTNRFDMNGLALCLMRLEMFTERVPKGGKLLYRDFKIRLHDAVYRNHRITESLLRQDCRQSFS